MLKEILEKIGLKNVEVGEIITPIDEYMVKNGFLDEDLKLRIKGIIIIKKGEEIEIQSVTPHEVVGYCKDKDIYIVIDKLDLPEFENLD